MTIFCSFVFCKRVWQIVLQILNDFFFERFKEARLCSTLSQNDFSAIKIVVNPSPTFLLSVSRSVATTSILA